MHQLVGWMIGLFPLIGAAAIGVLAVVLWNERRQPPRHLAQRDRAVILDAALILAVILILIVGLGPPPVDEAKTGVKWNFIPFGDFLRSLGGSVSLQRIEVANLLGNVALFLPLGAAAALRFRHLGPGRFVAVAVLISIGVELSQALEGLGRESDVTDVITNTAGAALGFAAARWAAVRLQRRW